MMSALSCYWVVPGKLLAGEYPRNFDEESSVGKIDVLIKLGVRAFIDLTGPVAMEALGLGGFCQVDATITGRIIRVEVVDRICVWISMKPLWL